MQLQRTFGLAALVCCSAWAPAQAQRNDTKFDLNTPADSKEDAHARMSYLADEIDRLRGIDAPEWRIAPLVAHLEALSASLGGDKPARHGPPSATAGVAPVASSGAQALSAPTCGNAALTTVNFPGTTGAILPAVSPAATFTATVSGAGTITWDVNLTTFFTHTDCSDLDVSLTSPAGTTITITTDNGGVNDNVYNGSVWDDSAAGLLAVNDVTYANNVVETPVHPEGRLTAFRGEDPNGVWTLSVADDTNTDTGALNAWSIDVTTVVALPVETTTNFTRSPGLVISSSGTPTVTDSMLVSGLATSISKLTLYVELPHDFAADLEMTLTAPSGTQLRVGSDNGGLAENVYNGTLFDPASNIAVSEYPYAQFVTVPLLAPEGSFDTLLGQDPNGTWTFTVFDDLGADGGTLVRWDLNISTAVLPVPSAPTNAAGTTGAIPEQPPAPPAAPTTFTTLVSGMGTYLWDVDLTTFIAHTAAADIDMTLTSPSGTVVEITTDSGGTNDNVFNGTLWDDNSNDTTVDHTYLSGVLAPLLTPEGRLSAFRGEDPNGVWTLTITDDATAADYGDLNAWSLDVATLTTAPGEITTTLSQSPGILISTSGTSSSLDTIAVSGLEVFVKEIEVFVQVAHTDCSDLDIFLTSPNGTVIKLTTDNGGVNDNVFNGTLFDSSSTDTITNHVYANNVVVPLIAPEGAFDNFIGEDPNGNWTLDVQDDLNTDGGTFIRWDLTIKTCVGAGTAFCTNDSLGIDHTTACPCGNTGAPGNGCGHSFDANGANMSATGSSAADTVVLHSQFEPVSSFTLMMQHANAGDSIFHDGVLCASNPLIRLRGRSAVAGEAFFPNSNFAQDSTTTLSIRGGTFPGSGATMRYAAWYRNASSTFCPPATANVTNGWVITW